MLSAVLLVNDKTALLININANLLKTKACSVRTTANGNEKNISLERLSLAGLNILNLNGNNITVSLSGGDLGASLELEALLTENLLGALGNFTVHTGANGVLELNDGHLRAETGPDRGHFKTNNTTTNDGETLGDFLKS